MSKVFLIIAVFLQIPSLANCQNESYLDPKFSDIKSLGLAYSEFDTISEGLYPNFTSLLQTSLINSFHDIGIDEVRLINQLVTTNSIDTANIITIMNENDFDAFLITKTFFLSRGFVYKGFLELDEIYKPKVMKPGNFDMYIELKVIDKSGRILFWDRAITITGTPSVSVEYTLPRSISKCMKELRKL